MITINGKQYPFWSQFVERQQEWIGGSLEDFGDSMDRRMFSDTFPAKTVITEITLAENGSDSAMFLAKGKDFTCGFDVEVGGVTGGEEGWITFNGYGGHKWRIKQPEKIPVGQGEYEREFREALREDQTKCQGRGER